jgi:hypothetical protein
MNFVMSVFLCFGCVQKNKNPASQILFVVHSTFSLSVSSIFLSIFRRQHFYFYHPLPLLSPSQSHMTLPNTSPGPLLSPSPTLPELPPPNRLQHRRCHLLSLTSRPGAISRQSRLHQHWRHSTNPFRQKTQLR